MRLSANQKAILITLYAIAERQGAFKPVPVMVLFRAVNSEREACGEKNIADRNFRVSCHTLARNGLLQKLRNTQSLQLLFTLSEQGAAAARPLYETFLAKQGIKDGDTVAREDA